MNFKSRKFVLTTILIIILISVFSTGGYILYANYQDSKKQEELAQQAEKESKRLLEESEAVEKQELENLRKELEELKANKPEEVEQIVKDVIKSSPAIVKSVNTSALVKSWEDNTLFVMCFMIDSYGDPYDISRGSGFLTQEDGTIYVFTNRHVLVNSYGTSADGCVAISSALDDVLVGTDLRGTGEVDDRDFGFFIPDNQVDGAYEVAATGEYCSRKPDIGDDVLILGYPTVGASESITVTQGIISGYDENYFVTSAKVEAGNSGGVAVLVKDNCYMGIPTKASIGQVESLARILDINKILNNY